MTAVEFIRDQVSEIVEQIKCPRTNKPEAEVPELVAELVGWMDALRRVEAAQ